MLPPPCGRTARLFGLSAEFYSTILNPFHGFNFSTANIDALPAVAVPVLDEVVPLTRTRDHMTWGEKNSTEVFEKAARGRSAFRFFFFFISNWPQQTRLLASYPPLLQVVCWFICAFWISYKGIPRELSNGKKTSHTLELAAASSWFAPSQNSYFMLCG